MTLSNFAKNLLAVFVGLLLLALFDAGLGLVGIESLARHDRFAGFSATKLFLPDKSAGGIVHYQRNPARSRYFNPQEFDLPKPPGEFRIFTLGGSTTYGRPYIDDTSFGTWLEKLLNRYTPGSNYRTINVGGISYASYRVRSLMAEMVDYQPDLFVVYTGHNEFLEARTFAAQKSENQGLRRVREILHHSRIYSILMRMIERLRAKEGGRLPADEVAARLEQVGGTELYHRDPQFRSGVIAEYRRNIKAMIELARQQGVPILFCTLPSNLSGVSPFKSEHRADLAAADWQLWQHAYDNGRRELAAGNTVAALKSFEAALEIDASYAELHYLTGRALELKQDYVAAYAAYARAREEDIVPLRALDVFNRTLREVSRDQMIPLADVEQFVRNISRNRIPGNDLFVDHVHPGIEGQQLVAWVILNELTHSGLVTLSPSNWSRAQVDAREFLRQEFETISPRYLAMGLWGVGRLFDWAGKKEEAWPPLLQAWQTVKDVPEIPRRLGLLALERGEPDLALKFLQEAERLEPGVPQVASGVARAYAALGRADEALRLLDGLPAKVQEALHVVRARAEVLAALGRRREAAAQLRRAIELSPTDSGLELQLAAQLFADMPQEARSHYRNYLTKAHLPIAEEQVENWTPERDL